MDDVSTLDPAGAGSCSSIGSPFRTVSEALHDAARRFADHPAVVGDRHISFAELESESAVLARSLLYLGVGHGDRVAVMAGNRADWPVVAAAVWRIGAVLVPLNVRLREPEVVDALRRTAAVCLFTDCEAVGADAATPGWRWGGPIADWPYSQVPMLRRIVVLRHANWATPQSPSPVLSDASGVVAFDEFVAGAPSVPEAVLAERERQVGPDDRMAILFTSGTSGTPKGAVLRHRAQLYSYAYWTYLAGLTEHDRFLLTSPYSNGPGMAMMIGSLLSGFVTVVVERFEPVAVLDVMVREQVTALLGPPNLYGRLLDAARMRDAVPSLRIAVVGLATVPASLIRRLRDEWTVETVTNAYGSTETTVISMTRSADPAAVVEQTCGRAVPGVEVRIVADDGTNAPAGTVGEIAVRSPSVITEYWNDPVASAAAIDADGWYRTGDLGVLDDRGHLRIAGRRREVFIVSGYNVYPAEVEAAFVRHDDVVAAAVVPVTLGGLGEIGVAFVVTDAHSSTTADALRAWADQVMASYKVPRHVIVVTELPLTANAKVDRQALMNRARAYVAEVTDAARLPGETAP